MLFEYDIQNIPSIHNYKNITRQKQDYSHNISGLKQLSKCKNTVINLDSQLVHAKCLFLIHYLKYGKWNNWETGFESLIT